MQRQNREDPLRTVDLHPPLQRPEDPLHHLPSLRQGLLFSHVSNQLTQTLQFHIGALLKLQVIQNSLKFFETQLSLEIVTQQHKKVNKAAYMAMGNDSISCCVLDSILNHLPNFFLTKLT